MTDPIVERGKPRPRRVSRAYFAEGSPGSLELEAMLDRVGLVNVLRALSNIANAKAVYSRTLAGLLQGEAMGQRCRASRYPGRYARARVGYPGVRGE
jgi:hypothetical protein